MTARAEAERRRDTGMARATDRADREKHKWSAKAMHALHLYCVQHPGTKFLGEQVREWAELGKLVPVPPDERSWGSIFRSAAADGLLKRVGYAPAKSSNLSPKCLWRAK